MFKITVVSSTPYGVHLGICAQSLPSQKTNDGPYFSRVVGWLTVQRFLVSGWALGLFMLPVVRRKNMVGKAW